MPPCESNKPELIQKPNQQQRALEEEKKAASSKKEENKSSFSWTFVCRDCNCGDVSPQSRNSLLVKNGCRCKDDLSLLSLTCMSWSWTGKLSTHKLWIARIATNCLLKWQSLQKQFEYCPTLAWHSPAGLELLSCQPPDYGSPHVTKNACQNGYSCKDDSSHLSVTFWSRSWTAKRSTTK